jgi:hypothetical protein
MLQCVTMFRADERLHFLWSVSWRKSWKCFWFKRLSRCAAVNHFLFLCKHLCAHILDVDECFNNPRLCQDKCVNLDPGYRCACTQKGFQVDARNLSACIGNYLQTCEFNLDSAQLIFACRHWWMCQQQQQFVWRESKSDLREYDWFVRLRLSFGFEVHQHNRKLCRREWVYT